MFARMAVSATCCWLDFIEVFHKIYLSPLMIRPVAFASVFLLAGWFMTHQLDVADGRDIVARWCALAEQRLGYLTELFESGRWRRFHSERDFLENIHEAKAAVKTWRDLLSREASRNNTAIDVSWLGRNRAALPRGESWRGPVRCCRRSLRRFRPDRRSRIRSSRRPDPTAGAGCDFHAGGGQDSDRVDAEHGHDRGTLSAAAQRALGTTAAPHWSRPSPGQSAARLRLSDRR